MTPERSKELAVQFRGEADHDLYQISEVYNAEIAAIAIAELQRRGFPASGGHI